MSRAAVNKSRQEKTKGGTSAAPTIAHEIVPGKFTDQDWNSMLDRDDGTEFASELVDELVDNTLAVIYETYLDRQLLPFTLSQAKDAILQIIDWQFLARDELEINLDEDITWQEDEEPLPALADCWAQGIVPRQVLPSSRLSTPQPTTTLIIDETIEPDEGVEDGGEPNVVLDDSDESDVDQNDADVNIDFSDSDPETEPQPVAEEKPHVKLAPMPQPPSEAKPKRKFRPHKGRLKSAGVGAMTETLYETEMRLFEEEKQQYLREMEERYPMGNSYKNLLKSQAGRPPGNKDVIYDDFGNVASVVKFNPAKLPSHFVKTGFTIVDPEVEAAQARLQAMKTGSYVSKAHKKKKVHASSLSQKGQAHDTGDKVDVTPRNLILPLPPPLIELMEVSAGVTVKEGERVKRGPKKWGKTGPQIPEEQLRVVRPPPEQPRLTAAEILRKEKPILKMIRDEQPIPPIQTN